MNQDRRNFMTKSLAIGMGSALSTALVLNPFKSASAFAAGAKSDGKDKNQTPKQLRAEVAKHLADCLVAGQACVAHCAIEFEDGNKEMAKCNKAVHDMLAVTGALLSLVSANSAFAKKVAAICADVCKTCADACGEHKEHFGHGMHLECKACMEACLECEKICRKYAA